MSQTGRGHDSPDGVGGGGGADQVFNQRGMLGKCDKDALNLAKNSLIPTLYQHYDLWTRKLDPGGADYRAGQGREAGSDTDSVKHDLVTRNKPTRRSVHITNRHFDGM